MAKRTRSSERRTSERIGSKQDLARRFRRFRESARLTQEQVAEKAGLSSKFLSQIETGRVNPSVEVVAGFVQKGLELSLAAFFGPDDLVSEIAALIGRQPAAVQRRAVHVLRALCEDIPTS